MITLREMEWSNWFSYGEDNSINFAKETVTQVLGTNGSGKSSILLILQEMLYGKNSAGIKKTAISNRYSKAAATGSLTFTSGDTEYIINIKRGSSLSISLSENGEDISSHTAAGTFKTIENIIGIDFKTFEQVAYQSSVASLQFLTATDTNRKNFLINLLNLSEYLEIHEKFKTAHKEVSSRLTFLKGSVNSAERQIEAMVNQETEKMFAIEIPKSAVEEKNILTSKEVDLLNITGKNKIISINNKAIEVLYSLEDDYDSLDRIQEPVSVVEEQKEVRELAFSNTSQAALITKLNNLDNQCATCLQPINEELKLSMCAEAQEIINNNTLRINELSDIVDQYNSNKLLYDAQQAFLSKYNIAKNAVDESIDTQELDSNILSEEVSALKDKIVEIEKAYNEAVKYNAKVEANNESIEKMKNLLNTQKESLKADKKELEGMGDIVAKLELLKNTFSTKGLVTFKIEFLIKDVEILINTYLSELSDGRFQLYFTMNGDKLNVDINDNGNIVDISALSMGERSRVNSATLLAIRSVMAELSDSKINLLFLDEILGTLDNFGKEKLIEILLEEHNLNTFLVSHEYTHPLLDKIEIVKEDNISRIEHG